MGSAYPSERDASTKNSPIAGTDPMSPIAGTDPMLSLLYVPGSFRFNGVGKIDGSATGKMRREPSRADSENTVLATTLRGLKTGGHF